MEKPDVVIHLAGYFCAEHTKEDIERLVESNIRFAMSEFNHPFILQQAADYKLNVINLGERRTMGSRQTEILVTNYSLNNTLF